MTAEQHEASNRNLAISSHGSTVPPSPREVFGPQARSSDRAYSPAEAAWLASVPDAKPETQAKASQYQQATTPKAAAGPGSSLRAARSRQRRKQDEMSERLTKVTINLIPRAMKALEEVCRSTGDTKTESINRGVQLYSWVQLHIDAGNKLYVVDPEGRSTEIRIF